MNIHGGLRGALGLSLILFEFTGLVSAQAQANTAPQPATVSAVMFSDLHLDPFHDPAKVSLLIKAPVEDWEAILKSPDSPGQQADFDVVQKTCKGKQSTDSSYALF